jgi:ABC-type antimicrobial peptide transport system permease subunit
LCWFPPTPPDPPHHPTSAERESEEDEIWRKQIAGKLRNLDKPHPHGLRAGLWLTLNYVMANAAKSSRNTAIGITTVLVVVFFIGVLQNIVLRAPLIFLRLAETTAGEMDMVIVPEAVNFDPLLNIDAGVTAIEKFSFFNATDLVARVTAHPEVSGATPRWILRGKVSRADRGSDGGGMRGGAGAWVGGLVTSILICDDEEEERMSIGRGWPHRPLGLGEAHVSASMLRSLGIDANRGQAISLNLGGGKLLSTFNLTASGLKETLIGSVIREGVSLTLNGSRIEEYLSGQGVAIPSGTFPARLQTRVPLAEVIDLERLITSTVDGVSSGDLLSLRLSVVDGVKDTFERCDSPPRQHRLPKPCARYHAFQPLPQTLNPEPCTRYPPIGNIVLLNSRHFLDAFKASFNAIPLVQMLNLASNTNKTGDVESALLLKDTPVTDALLGDDMNQYAFSLVVMYKNRLRAYLKDTQGTHDELTRFANVVGEELGQGLQITLPVHDALVPLKYLRIFLQQIFNSVVFVLICHGCLTIYALLLSDTTARTYEYGMLRMMGMRQSALGQLLMVQAMMYAVPGVLLGLLLSWAASYPILLIISEYSATEPDFSFRGPAIVTAATLGILMSVAGNIVPIRRALSRSLAGGGGSCIQSPHDPWSKMLQSLHREIALCTRLRAGYHLMKMMVRIPTLSGHLSLARCRCREIGFSV